MTRYQDPREETSINFTNISEQVYYFEGLDHTYMYVSLKKNSTPEFWKIKKEREKYSLQNSAKMMKIG